MPFTYVSLRAGQAINSGCPGAYTVKPSWTLVIRKVQVPLEHFCVRTPSALCTLQHGKKGKKILRE